MVENLLMKKNVPFTVRGTFPCVNFRFAAAAVSRSPGKKVAEVEGVLGVHMACSNEWNSFSGFLDVKKDEIPETETCVFVEGVVKWMDDL